MGESCRNLFKIRDGEQAGIITLRNDYSAREMLIRAALGEIPADVVIKNGKIVDVYTGEIFEANVGIKGKRIALVGNTDHMIGKNTEIIDAGRHFLAPGLMDPHMHVYSTMVTICELARAIVPQGVTSLVINTHAMSFVLGTKGVELLSKDGKKSILKTFICPPSRAPQSPGLATTSGRIGSEDIRRLLHSPDIEALGEVTPRNVFDADHWRVAFSAASRSRKTISGHTPALRGKELNAFIAGGVQDTHNATTVDEAQEILRLGMKIVIQEASGIGKKCLDNVIGIVTEKKMDPRHIMLCTDNLHPDDIIDKQHLDHVVRKAISRGVDPIAAIQMVTLNPAEHFGLSRDLGSIAPGRYADVIFLEDLRKFNVRRVMVDGRIVAVNGKMTIYPPYYKYPRWAFSTIKVRKKITPEDLKVPTKVRAGKVKVRVIKMLHYFKQEEMIAELSVREHGILADPNRDILKIVVVERHLASGKIGKGFVSGFELKNGAIASTQCPDHHNITAVGTSDGDIAIAVNRIIEIKGGLTAVSNGKIIAEVKLPIAGLLSPEPIDIIAEKLNSLNAAIRNKLGTPLTTPFMLLAPVVSPFLPGLRITDKGLVNTNDYKVVPLIVSQEVTITYDII